MQVQAAFPVSMSRLRDVMTLLLAAALAACATVSPAPSGAVAENHPAVAPVPVESDLIAKLLSAQFALQDNDLKNGAQGFADASALSNDPAIAEEATRLALTVKDWPLATRSLARWQQLAPKDAGVLQAKAWIAQMSNRTFVRTRAKE